MAKGAISKPRKGPSLHSRAARRATSPGIDTDKSLKNVKAPESASARPAVLAAHHNGGVTKKTKRKTALSSRARKRHEKSMDRAEAVMDRTALKVQKSKGHFRVIQTRNRAWDEINKEVVGGPEVPPKKKQTSGDQAEDDAVAAFYADDDEEMDEVEEPEHEVEQAGSAKVAPVAPLPDDEDEIL